MRRLLLIATAGLVLAPVAACTNQPAEEPAQPGSTASASASESNSPNGQAGGSSTEAICAEFDALIDTDALTAEFGTSIGQYLVARQAGQTEQQAAAEATIKQQLTDLATSVSDLAARAQDPVLESQLTAVATQVTGATDLSFLSGVETVEDLQAPLTAMMVGWITPVATTCTAS